MTIEQVRHAYTVALARGDEQMARIWLNKLTRLTYMVSGEDEEPVSNRAVFTYTH